MPPEVLASAAFPSMRSGLGLGFSAKCGSLPDIITCLTSEVVSVLPSELFKPASDLARDSARTSLLLRVLTSSLNSQCPCSLLLLLPLSAAAHSSTVQLCYLQPLCKSVLGDDFYERCYEK